MKVEQYTLSRKGTDTKSLVHTYAALVLCLVGFLRLMTDRLECVMGQCMIVVAFS